MRKRDREHLHDLTVGTVAAVPAAIIIGLAMWCLTAVMDDLFPGGATGSDSTPEPVVATTVDPEPEPLPDIMDPFSYSPEMLAALDVPTLLELQEQDREEALRCSGSGA